MILLLANVSISTTILQVYIILKSTEVFKTDASSADNLFITIVEIFFGTFIMLCVKFFIL